MKNTIKIELSDKQNQSLEAFKAGHNLCILGSAGTGKSTLIEYMRKVPDKNIAILAPTGLAAKNISGTTLHSFFSLPFEAIDKGRFLTSCKRRRKLRAVDCIIIDEISMVRSDVFWAVDYALRKSNKKKLPFGGCQVVLLGDFHQLPPVVSDPAILQYLKATFGGKYAFCSESWKNAKFMNIILNRVYRQKDDKFMAILESVRHCDNNIENNLAELNQKIDQSADFDYKRLQDLEQSFLCTTNTEADIINRRALSSLHDEGFISKADFKVHNNKNISTGLVEKSLHIKKGAKVMMLINSSRNEKSSYVNGDVGIIEDYDSQKLFVQIRLADGRLIKVFRHIFEFYNYSLSKDSNGKIYLIKSCGLSVTQFPFQLAYSCTIHKSQGQSLSKVHLKLGRRGCFENGQLYSALSRLRTIDGLTLDRPIELREALPDPQIVDFYANLSN